MRYLYIYLITIIFLISCREEKQEPSSNMVHFSDYPSYVEVQDHSSLNPVDDISVSFWIYAPSGLDCDLNNNWRSILKKSFAFETGQGYSIVLEENLQLSWDVGTEGGTNRHHGGSLPLGEWTHLVFTYSSANSLAKTYINGSETAGTTWSLGNGKIVGSGSNLFINISSQECPNTIGHFDGYMDELSIWNVALDPQDAASLMNKKLKGSEAGLVSYWSFDSRGNGFFEDPVSGNDGKIMGNPELISSCLPNPEVVTSATGCPG